MFQRLPRTSECDARVTSEEHDTNSSRVFTNEPQNDKLQTHDTPDFGRTAMKLYTPREAAQVLGISYPTLKQWIYKGSCGR